MKAILEVDKGANQGTHYEIEAQAYRVVGRAGGKDVTVALSFEGDRVLEPDDMECIEEHLAGRGPRRDKSSGQMRIGSFQRGRDILLDDDGVSRTHAMIFVDEEGPSIVDLLSMNGTLVNGDRTGGVDLRDGDIINIGQTRFVLRLVD